MTFVTVKPGRVVVILHLRIHTYVRGSEANIDMGLLYIILFVMSISNNKLIPLKKKYI